VATKPARIIILAALLLLLPFIFRAVNSKSNAANRILSEVAKAERQVKSAGLSGIDQFAKDLRSINTADAPPRLSRALSDYASAVEANGAIRQAGGNATESNEAVATAKRVFVDEAAKHRGQPF